MTMVTQATSEHACMFNFENINPNNRRSNSSGYIGPTSGYTNRGPGEWQICFRQIDGATGTAPAFFTVVGLPGLPPTTLSQASGATQDAVYVPATEVGGDRNMFIHFRLAHNVGPCEDPTASIVVGEIAPQHADSGGVFPSTLFRVPKQSALGSAEMCLVYHTDGRLAAYPRSFQVVARNDDESCQPPYLGGLYKDV